MVGVNDGGWLYPGRLDHWVTLHWERMPEWIARRADSGYETWTRDTRKLARSELRPDWLLPHWGTGTSGLYGVTVATHLKADRVVLAGVPLTATPYEAGAGTWEGAWPETEVLIHRDGWTYWHKHGRLDHVRSCSGWTAELLGDPFAAGWI